MRLLLPLLPLLLAPLALALRPPLSEVHYSSPDADSDASASASMGPGPGGIPSRGRGGSRAGAHAAHVDSLADSMHALLGRAPAPAPAPMPVSSEQIPYPGGKQATRAQVVERHKARMRGERRHPATSPRPVTCSDYASYHLRLTRAADSAPFTVASDGDDSTAHAGFAPGAGSTGLGSEFKLGGDCRLSVPDLGLIANISPGRKRDNVYFSSAESISEYNYRAASCVVAPTNGGGGGYTGSGTPPDGRLTCSIPGTGVATLCTIGDVLIIRQGPCDASLREVDAELLVQVL